MFRHILVPLDGSELAEAALPHALAVARRFGQRITLVQVVPPQHSDFVEVMSSIDRLAARDAGFYLQNVQRALEEEGIECQYRVIANQPVVGQIVRCAQRSNVDAIIMSTHGRSGLQRWMLGSVAEKLLRTADLPVLLVRVPTEADASDTPGGWLRRRADQITNKAK